MNDNNNLNQQVIDKMTKVCICRAISRAKIKEAIKNGAHTVEAVAEKTGATKVLAKVADVETKLKN